MPEDHVRLSIPASPSLVRLARLTAAGVGSRAGFGYDDIEDLRIAVAEACSLVLGEHPSPDDRLELDYVLGSEALEVTIRRTGPSSGGPAPQVPVPQLSSQILDAVVDSHHVGTDESGVPTARIRKRRPEAV